MSDLKQGNMTERKPPDWYPTSVNRIIDLDNDPSPYGNTNPEVLNVLEGRLAAAGISKARIVDIAGGYGRNAMPLAEAGHNVTIVDIDVPHLTAAQRNARRLSLEAGNITTVLADITKDEDISKIGDGFDASLNEYFLYLAPPAEAITIFKRYAPIHRLGGLAVVQFSTNIIRKDKAGNALSGDTEYSYTQEEGRQLLEEMFEEAGFGELEITAFTIHNEEPYYYHADALVASGIRKT
jgi:SAM-dependent methyltransferase